MAMLNIVTVGICINTIIIMLNNYLLQAGDTVRLTALLASDTRSQVGLMSFLPIILRLKRQIQGVFFNWCPPKKLKCLEPRLGESTST